MALDKQVESAVEALLELGVLNEDGLRKLGAFFDSLKVFRPSRPTRKPVLKAAEPPEALEIADEAEELPPEPQSAAEPDEGETPPAHEPEPEHDSEPYTIKSSLWNASAKANGNGHSPAKVEAEPDPEFSQELPGEHGQSGFEEQDKQVKRKALPGFVPGYNEANLKKEPIQFRKRAPRGSFNLPASDLQKLREIYTVKQIATNFGVSIGTVTNKLREYGLTDSSKGRPRK